MYAAAFGHREVVLLILAAFKQLHHVAYHGQRNGQGLTASQLAERNGHEDIAALLKVEDAVFPRPAGPSAFIPAHPLDLDRPPTPTETRSIRSSFRRSRAAAKATEAEPLDPTAPLPPPALAKSVKSRGSGKLSSSFKLTSKLVSRDSWDADEEPASTSEAVLSRREGGVSRRKGAVLAKSKSIDAIVETGYDPTSARARDRSIVGWETEIEENREITKKNQREEEKGKTEPVRVAGPDRLEKQVLEELMKGLVVTGSPGSGNEADTESLMECERSGPDHEDDSADARMSGGNGRKTAVSGPSGGSCSASISGQAMPKIDLSASSRSLNRSIQHLVQEDTENRPGHRPPTPARPSLPTLLPGRLLDVSLSASVGSTKSEGRSVAPSRRVTFSSFPRSASEPRSLTVSPTRNLRPEDDDDDEDETVTDLLDSSTRSEGWDHIRGARGRGPSCTPSEGHVVPLPPINQPRFSEFGVRGREGIRGRSGLAGGEDNVLNVAKKTLEQLESVLAPSEGAALPRHIPRTRTSQQIHLET